MAHVSILSCIQTRFSRPRTRTRTRHYNTIQPNTTTGWLFASGSSWRQDPRYTGARKGRPWVAHNLFHERRPPDRRQALRQTCFQQTCVKTNVRHNSQVLTATWNLTCWRSSATNTWQANEHVVDSVPESKTSPGPSRRSRRETKPQPGDDQPGDRTHQAERDRAHQDPQNC